VTDTAIVTELERRKSTHRQMGESAGLCHLNISMSLPPGLLDDSDSQCQYVETSSGGDHEWLDFTSIKLYTNAFIVLPGPPRKVVTLNQIMATPSYATLTDSARI
jgi:hypothetical protein